MPRATTLECPGCPPLRALTFDVLGLVKVVEARSKEGGNPKVVERWGDPDSSKCVLATSFDDTESNPLLALARKNGMIEMISPFNGDLSFSISHVPGDETSSEDDPVVGLHLFKNQRFESSARSCPLMTCTTKGNASFRIVEAPNSPSDPLSVTSFKAWSVCGSGSISCCKVDASEKYSLFGGKGVEVCIWDLENTSKFWAAKPPPKNSLGIFTPTWFTSATFLSNDDHRKIVAGTSNHQVRLYDTSAQRRPVLSVDFRETPIKAIAEDADGHKIYIGNGYGDLASIDIRTGKLLGCFIGKCSGSIRSIVRHPELPVLASCGLDSYVRFWDIESRQLLSSVFLKQPLTSVVFDSSFSDDGPETVAEEPRVELQDLKENQLEDSDEEIPSPSPINQKKVSKKSRDKKQREQHEEDTEDDSDTSPTPTKQKRASKKSRDKKQEQQLEEINGDDSGTSPTPTKQKKSSKKNRDKKKKQLEEFNGDDSDNEYNEDPAPVKRKKGVKEGAEKKLKAKKRSKKADLGEAS